MLSRGIALKAIGWLQKAHAASPAEWDAAVLALGDDGRFTVYYMTQQRKLMRDAQLARQQFLRNGGGFDAALTAGQARAHVAANIANDEMARTVAKSIANATSAIHRIPLDDATFEMRKVAAETALVTVLRERNMALAVAPVMPATSTADAIQSLVIFLFPARAQAALGADRPSAQRRRRQLDRKSSH